MVINEAGTYTLVYTATDECGNTTTVEREVVVSTLETFRTVLYTDGTLIINEGSNSIDANVAEHGVATNVYDPLDADHPYVFTFDGETMSINSPWWNEHANITSVEIGSAIQPTSTALWFDSMENCTSMDLSLMDTSNVTDMNGMFGNCSALTSLDLSSFNTSNVTDMNGMFGNCSALTSLDLSSFDTSSVTNMRSMFFVCVALTTITTSVNFVTTNVSNSSGMFINDTNLVGGNGTVYDAHHIDATYARIDTADTPGYFTASA